MTIALFNSRSATLISPKKKLWSMLSSDFPFPIRCGEHHLLSLPSTNRICFKSMCRDALFLVVAFVAVVVVVAFAVVAVVVVVVVAAALMSEWSNPFFIPPCFSSLIAS